jgi:hypothetical protein
VVRKALKAMAWLVGGLLGLVAALYAVAVAVNWRDREPSAAALRLATLYRERPAIADDDNGFVYLLGFDAAPGERPQALGARRYAELRRASEDRLPRSPSEPREPRERPAVATAFVAACGRPVTTECVALFEDVAPLLEQWLAADAWVLERYVELLDHRAWSDAVSPLVLNNLPPFYAVLDGQRLWLLSARVGAERGDTAAVRAALETDIRFWREVLESADTLISKMIALAALIQHFALGNLVLRALPAGSAAAALPAEWREPLTDAELSLQRVMVGEWVWVSGSLSRGLEEPGVWQWRVDALLYQPQDTLNRFSDYMWAVQEILSVPPARLEAAMAEAEATRQRLSREAFSDSWLYNFLGSGLLKSGPADFGPYAARVADTEGIRRVALLAVSLRDAGVAAEDVAAAVASSALHEPYRDRPFEWDASEGTLVFRGLEPRERGVHRIHY